MSMPRREKISCPACGTKGETTIYDSLNVTLDPEDKERVLNGELFMWECPNCHKRFHLDFGFLYHDMGKNLMISFDPDEGKPSENEAIDFSALSKFGVDNYSLRSVHGEDNLKEKILIFDAGLNDVAIELIKLSVHSRYKELQDCEIYFNQIQDKENIVFYFYNKKTNESGTFDFPYEGYEDFVKDFSGRPELSIPKGQFVEVNIRWLLERVNKYYGKKS